MQRDRSEAGSTPNIAFPAPAASVPHMTLKAIVHQAEEGGFWAEVPAMPGCVTQGEAIEELRANLHEAIEGWLEAGESERAIGESDHILELAV
jgi:predicted RNase H-like HicB family nuclease